MSALAGTGSLVRLALRLDRIKLTIWILALTGLTATTASAFEGLYPTVVERQAFGLTIGANPAIRGLLGPIFDASSIGGLTAWRVAAILGVLGGLMGHQTVVRHTRAEEENGRLELIGAGVVGRHAALAAAWLVTFGAGALVGVATASVLIGSAQDTAGSAAFGVGVAGVICMFGAIGAVAAQLTTSSRAANDIAGAILGTAFLLRATGDTLGDEASAWPSWVSPIGWFQQLRPFADERWWVVGLMVAFVMVMVAAAHAMVVRRDVDAGLLPARPGPAVGGQALGSAFGLAWRLQRGVLLGWVVAVAVWSAVIGGIAQSAGDLLNSSDQLQEIVERLGGAQNVTDTYIAATLGILGLATAAYAIQAALRMRSEETALRAEPVLATDVGRTRWVCSHLAFAVGGPAVLLAVSGLAMGLAHGLRSGEVGTQVPRLIGAAVVQLPATWVLAGVALLLFGALPRLATAAWGALVAVLLIGQLGQVLQLDQWILDLSPFTHVPQLPGGELTWTPLAWLTAVALAFAAIGTVGFRRRDVG